MAHEEEEPDKRGFKVQDRRRFSATGDPREQSGEAERPAAPPGSAAAEAAPPPGGESAAGHEHRGHEHADHDHDHHGHEHADHDHEHHHHDDDEHDHHHGGEPEINFSTFVLSLSTQALAYLGEIPSPHDNSTHVDLVAARQFIDILAMLQEKTAGNLDRSEAEILEHALYDLRMRFVDHSQRR